MVRRGTVLHLLVIASLVFCASVLVAAGEAEGKKLTKANWCGQGLVCYQNGGVAKKTVHRKLGTTHLTCTYTRGTMRGCTAKVRISKRAVYKEFDVTDPGWQKEYFKTYLPVVQRVANAVGRMPGTAQDLSQAGFGSWFINTIPKRVLPCVRHSGSTLCPLIVRQFFSEYAPAGVSPSERHGDSLVGSRALAMIYPNLTAKRPRQVPKGDKTMLTRTVRAGFLNMPIGWMPGCKSARKPEWCKY